MDWPEVCGLEAAEMMLALLAGLFVIEQFLCWFPGSLPYRHGIPVKRIFVSPERIAQWTANKDATGKVITKVNKWRNEIYLRYKYPFGVLGPLLFVGQITDDNSQILTVRIGIASLALAVYLLGYPFLVAGGNTYRIVNALAVPLLVYWLYLVFLKSLGLGTNVE